MDNNSISTQQNLLSFSPDKINTIRNTVAKGANDDELRMFLDLASTYQLNPFAHEIWFIKYKSDNPTIITSRDGYLKIANRNPHFSGMISDVVYSGDKFSKSSDGVNHLYNAANRGNIIGAYCLVYRDDRKFPAYFFAPLSDYKQNSNIWSKYTHAMILKVAEAMTLKRAFSISGLVTQEELDSEFFYKADKNDNNHKQITQRIWASFLQLYNGDKDEATNSIKMITGDIPSSQWDELTIKALFSFLDEQQQIKNSIPVDVIDEPINEDLQQ